LTGTGVEDGPTTKSEIWRFGPDCFKVYTEDLAAAAKIAGWKGCRFHASYFFPDGRFVRDILIPRKLYKRAAALLGLPLPRRNPNRVRAGKKAGAAALARGQLRRAGAPSTVPTDNDLYNRDVI